MTITDYPFTEADARRAYEEWHCNCGPSALAFALRLPLGAVRHAIPGFEEKRYTSPTMMKAALANLGRQFDAAPCGLAVALANLFHERMALVRVQWTGPWTAPGANPRWAYRQTHWVATWRDDGSGTDWVFDVNGGIASFGRWQGEIVPLLTKATPRADGGWHPTHIWRLKPCSS